MLVSNQGLAKNSTRAADYHYAIIDKRYIVKSMKCKIGWIYSVDLPRHDRSNNVPL